MKCDVFTLFIYFSFINNAPQINVAGDLVTLLEHGIVSVFVGQFRCGLQRFFSGKKSHFQDIEQI